MTFSSPQIIRAKAEASLEQAQTAFWFPVLPGLQALPGTPTVTTNATPAPANAVPVPVGFNEDNPDLADLFANILPKGVAPVHPKTMAPAAGLIVPPYNEIQTWDARIRVPAEATLLPFSNEIVHVAAATLKVQSQAIISLFGNSSVTFAITGTAAGTVATVTRIGNSSATLAITRTSAGTVRVAGASSATLAITGSATGGTPAPSYRYWRMQDFTLVPAAAYLDWAEVQFSTSADPSGVVSDVPSGASAATASPGPDAAGAIADINDGNTSTRAAWEANTITLGVTINIDMGTPRAITHWRQRPSGASTRSAAGLQIRASTDGTTYTTIATLSGMTVVTEDTYGPWQSLY